jgi:carboxypeptidase Q
VILGAHLDSWELGTGALDNGCNAAMVIAAARAIQQSKLRPRRTLRFVLFSGEEEGFQGSYAYVLQHRGELDRVSAVIVYDSGTGRVTGYSLNGREDLEQRVTQVLAPLASWGVEQHTLDAGDGTDNLDFLLEGVPNLVANQDESNYMVNYHASTDTLDKVDMRALQLHVAIAAVTTFGIADRPQRIGPRQTRTEIEALMRRTGLDKQLQDLGYWPEWQSGARGRHP